MGVIRDSSPSKKIAAAAMAAVLLVTIAVLVLRDDGSVGGTVPAVIAGGERLTANASTFSLKESYSGPAFISGLEDLPASLRGTDVDGQLKIDGDGNLVMDAEVRYLFDYFLSTIGEEPLATIVARIRAFLQHTLPATAAAQAEAALDGYLAYREALAHMQTSATIDKNRKEMDTAALREQKAQMKELRTRLLAPDVARAFYADEEAYDDYSLARLDVLRDPSLSATEKAARATALIDTLPPALQESVRTQSLYNNLQELTTEWQKRSGPPAELRSIREAAVGTEATDRLEALDAERAAWQSRINEYLRERARVLAAGLADSDKERQIEDLRRARFSTTEQLRLGAFETAPANPAAAMR